METEVFTDYIWLLKWTAIDLEADVGKVVVFSREVIANSGWSSYEI